MKRSKRNPVIYPLIENKDKKLRVDVEYLDERLERTVYQDPLFNEHVTEVSIALGIDREKVDYVIKSYTRNVLHMLHSKVKDYTRIVVPQILDFKLFGFKHKK